MQIRYPLGIYTIIKYVWNLKAVIYDQYNINYADIINFTIGLLKNNLLLSYVKMFLFIIKNQSRLLIYEKWNLISLYFTICKE